MDRNLDCATLGCLSILALLAIAFIAVMSPGVFL